MSKKIFIIGIDWNWLIAYGTMTSIDTCWTTMM